MQRVEVKVTVEVERSATLVAAALVVALLLACLPCEGKGTARKR